MIWYHIVRIPVQIVEILLIKLARTIFLGKHDDV